MKNNLLTGLRKVRWDVAFKTFGSNHSTLIGLLVEWWIVHGYGRNRYALESGCTFKSHKQGKGSKRCDAVLVEGDNAQGIVEVEGSYHKKTLRKMEKFFQAGSEWKSLKFGIFLAYPTYASGQKEKRNFCFEYPEKKLFEIGQKISAKSPNKSLAVLILEKRYERIKSGLRSRIDYYKGKPVRIYGKLFLNGKIIAERTLEH